MTIVQNYLRNHLITSLLSLIGAGFLIVLADLLFAGHFVGIQLAGLFATILGFLLTVHGILSPVASRKLAVAFLVLALFGALGSYQHYETTQVKSELTEIQHRLLGQAEEESLQLGPPLLAPLSLSGLALFAMLLLLANEPTPAPEPTP